MLGVLLSLLATLIPTPADSQNWYQACGDHDYTNGYDAVKATIQVVPTALADGVSVWCGIDDGRGTMWLQAGWRKYTTYASARAYLEYVPEQGIGYRILEELGDAYDSEYEVLRSGGIVYIYAKGIIQAQLNWSDFDARKMCKSQYGAEIHSNPGDHVPGTSSNKCGITNASVRSYGSSIYSSATFITCWQTTACGDVQTSGSNLYVWDNRTLSQTACP